MSGLGDAYAAMQPPQKCICGEYPQGHPSGLCDACVAKRSKPAERRPCAGWEGDDRNLWLRVGVLAAHAVRYGADSVWHAEIHVMGGALAWRNPSPWGMTLEAAQLAAEDALLAVRDAITRAVGR